MIVSSPIGELPFVPTRLKYQDKGLVMEGRMGAWPATVKIGLEDTGSLLRVIAKPAVLVIAAAAVATLLVQLIPRLFSR